MTRPISKKALRERLVTATAGCCIQHTGWPCNTCFHALELPLRYDIHRYWLAVLTRRGDYPNLPQKPGLINELATVLQAKRPS